MKELLRDAVNYICLPLINRTEDENDGENFVGDYSALTNRSITAVIFSAGSQPVVHSLSGSPVLIGKVWYLALTQAEMNTTATDMIITIDADELATQNIHYKIVNVLSETALSNLTTAVSNLATALSTLSSDTSTQIAACLQSSAYTAPDNTSIAAIKTKTDNLPASPANESTLSTGIEALLDAIADCLQAANYTAPDDTAVRDDIAALNNISVADITGSTAFKQLLAAAKGRFTKSSNTYTFYDTDGTTALFTLTVSDTGRTVS